jgi:hypothetical protein
MRLPGHTRAIIDELKLVDYCLSPDHRRGKHKARVFRSKLGLAPSNWTVLRDAIVVAIGALDAVGAGSDAFGSRYHVDFEMRTDKGSATVRCCWIIRRGEDFPRLTSCYVLL